MERRAGPGRNLRGLLTIAAAIEVIECSGEGGPVLVSVAVVELIITFIFHEGEGPAAYHRLEDIRSEGLRWHINLQFVQIHRLDINSGVQGRARIPRALDPLGRSTWGSHRCFLRRRSGCRTRMAKRVDAIRMDRRIGRTSRA